MYPKLRTQKWMTAACIPKKVAYSGFNSRKYDYFKCLQEIFYYRGDFVCVIHLGSV